MSIGGMTLRDARHGTSGPRRASTLSPRARARSSTLVAIALVVVVITVASLVSSSPSAALVKSQHRYLTAVTPVEEADVIFNGSRSSAADHSIASTRVLVAALGDEFSELNEVQWPPDVTSDVGALVGFTRTEAALLQRFETAPLAKRPRILNEQSVVANEVDRVNVRILRLLKLPTPTNATAPVSSGSLAP